MERSWELSHAVKVSDLPGYCSYILSFTLRCQCVHKRDTGEVLGTGWPANTLDRGQEKVSFTVEDMIGCPEET